MLLEWTGQGPLSLPDPRKSGNYRLASNIVCTPGINKVADDLWHGGKDSRGEPIPGLKENTQIVALMAKGKLVVKREKDFDGKTAKTKGEALDLTGLPEDQALEFVKKTLNKDLLTDWADSETRPKLARAITEQLRELTIVSK